MIKGTVTRCIVVILTILFIGVNSLPSILGDNTQQRTTLEKVVQQLVYDTLSEQEWNNTFGGDLDDAAYEVYQTTDGGYILGGYTKSYGAALWSPWLIKTDSSGDEVWNRTYLYYSLAFLSGYVQSVQQTTDGGYILGCSFFNTTLLKSEETFPFDIREQDYQSVMVLIKTDSDGNEQWNRTYVGLEYSWCLYVRQTSDGGFIVTGYGNTTSSDSMNLYLLKTYSDGTMQWLRTYGTSDLTEEGHWVQQTSDGGYCVVGLSDCNYDTEWGKIWLIKTDPNGFITWDKKFEGASRVGAETYGNSVQQTTDGGFIIAGLVDNQGCLLKTDSNGNEIWRKTPFLNDFSFFCFSASQTFDGGFIATGNGIIKTDGLGEELWNATIPTPFTSGQQTSDGGYVITGSTSGYYNGDAWLIKFTPEEETPDVTFTITGGFGVHVDITNNGTSDANDVAWQITVKGGIFGLINYTVNGLADIAVGMSTKVGTGMFLGLGDIQITATVGEMTKQIPGTHFIILTTIKK